MKTCEVCGQPHDGSYGSGRFCSKHCYKAFVGKRSVAARRERGTMAQHMEDARVSRTLIHDQTPGRCRFCGKECKNQNSLLNHERLCKQNPDAQESKGNHGNMPKHTRHYYTRPMTMKGGVVLNVTRAFVDQYKAEHPVCEICGKSVDEVVKTESKFGPHGLCVDHDHTTMKFRGVLCSVCNRQLGWYEKNKEAIQAYLSKNLEA